MAQVRFFGNGIDSTFKMPLNAAITGALVNGGAGVVSSRTPFSVTLSAVVPAGQPVDVTYSPMERTTETNANPATGFASVTPSDTVDVPQGVFNALFVGVGGDVSLLDPQTQTPVVFKNVPAGTTLPGGCARVMQSGTTATNLVALYN